MEEDKQRKILIDTSEKLAVNSLQEHLLLDSQLPHCDFSYIVASHLQLSDSLERTSIECDWERVQEEVK